MKFHSPMIVVGNIENSKKFYLTILDEEISQDLGTYVVFGGGFSMMTREQWVTLTNDIPAAEKNPGHHFELYFEEDDLDNFIEKLKETPDIRVFTDLQEAPWGQRTIRILDPDDHIIEVSESMEKVVKRMLSSGMTVQKTSEKSMMPIEFIEKCGAELDTKTE